MHVYEDSVCSARWNLMSMMTWLTKRQLLSITLFKWVNKTLFCLVSIFVHTSFFVFVTNDFKSASLALLAKKGIVIGWMVLLVFSVTFQCHFEKCWRTNFCSSVSLKDWSDLILGFALKIVKISSANYFAWISSTEIDIFRVQFSEHNNENVIKAAIQIHLRLLINSLI